MKAAIWHEKKDIRIEEINIPVPGSNEVLVKIKACGICGSDLHEYNNGPFIIPSKPHPLTGLCAGPVILGHEFSAEVVESGTAVTGYMVGDRVTASALIVCNECHYCKTGAYNMCIKLGSTGFAANGGFAEYAILQDYALYRLPDSVNDDMGTFVEPLSVAIHAVKRSRLKIGDTAIVIGAGPVGLLVMQACIFAGATQVYIVEPIKKRRDIALKCGASAVFDPSHDDVGKAITMLTNGLRANVAFDCVGSQAAFDTAMKVTGRRGTICVVGLSIKSIQTPFIRLWGHEKEIVFSSGYENEFPIAIKLLESKKISVVEMISGRINLENLIEKGIRPLVESAENYIKIIVYPNDSIII